MCIRMKKMFAMLMSAVILLILPGQLVHASSEQAQTVEVLPCIVRSMYNIGASSGTRATTFSDTTINVACSSDGMYVAIHTCTTKEASVIGVKEITIDRLLYGSWVTVATASGGEVYNTAGCVISLNYDDAIYNGTYRVTCVHYANVDGYRELYHETESMKFVY